MRVPFLSKWNERIAMPNYWRARINPRITGGHARMLENYVADKDATRPSNPLVAAALSEVKSRGLRKISRSPAPL